ncbi:hypothetical protein [Hyalangium sp.]|uniref:hypothetical protein n=1 Tax=Hyalangium sp. TaxID=2028555 RepID=UPI002D35C403|nr:hypothetical protein [Hyalangium sp.]HYH97506.1 hypothetical protein [Hyalangium sp.]
MMLRRAVVASIVLTASCAPMQKQGVAAAPVQDTVRVSNQHPFDVAVCQASQAAPLPQPVNPDIMLGALSAARPQVMECLVPATSRGEGKSTRVVVRTQVSDQGGKHTVSGENLTPEGQACVQKAVESLVPLAASPKGAAPMSAETEFTHEQGRSLAVILGSDSGSDYSGAVRLGQPQWCDCYAAYTTQVPPTLMARVHLAKGQATPAEVSFDPVTAPEGTALATCLQQKLMALPVTPPPDAMRFSRRFIHFNSKAAEPSTDPLPEQRFIQNELVRQQRAADTMLAFGARDSAAEAYDAVVMKSQKSKDKKLAAELVTRCNQVAEADAKWVGAIEAQLKADQQALAIAQELKVKDAAAWTPAEASVQGAITSTQEELKRAQDRLAADRDACSKMKS